MHALSSRDAHGSRLFIFGPDGRAAPYGFTVVGAPTPELKPVPRRRTSYLRQQALRGPWIAAWEDRPWHPYNVAFREAGVRAIAYAPVRHDGDVIGFLHLSTADPEAEEALAGSLPALVEFADIAGALLGAKLADRTQAEHAG